LTCSGVITGPRPTQKASFPAIVLRLGIPLVAALLASTALDAQETRPALVHSIGQPPIWQPYGAGSTQFTAGETNGAMLMAGVQRAFLNPVTGLAALAGEGYGSLGGGWPGGGVRFLARSPALALALGADLHVGRGGGMHLAPIFSYQSSIRRGGLFGAGTMLRVDWLPTRRQSLAVGVHVPVRPLAGRTRPRSTLVQLPRGAALDIGDSLPLRAEQALAQVASSASILRATSSLHSAADVALLRANHVPGSTASPYARASTLYHGELAAAFAASSGVESLGDSIARRARAGLLDHVLVPYDTLFGQPKSDDIRGLTSRAQASFAGWLRDSTEIREPARAMTLATHARWLRIIETVHRELARQWKDSRMIWMPLHLALQPDQLDDQVEIDSILGRLAGRPFTDNNALTYLRSTDLPLEIARSIYAARDYHVIWTHDFSGVRDETGALDKLSFEMVADAYFPALTAAVRRYDETGRLPVYMILLDQYFYEPRRGRLWMTILENPLAARIDLPGDEPDREAHLRQRQEELRAAVAASQRLQRDAASAGGDSWLRRLVKVHVNILYPSDFSFRSHRIIPGIPFTPDDIMRDHRKIVLYDANELDPYAGAMFMMGVGIGEHYASQTWEDRGQRLRGPALLEARAALRRVLRDHGFDDESIPAPLRERADGAAVEDAANQHDFIGRALQVHNEAGFGRKQSSVLRAALYDLASPWTVVVVPDPLWLSAEWGAMLAGAAARGARVHVISPADANAPSPQAPIRALAHEVMDRLLYIRTEMAEVMRASGGELRVGLYASRTHVDDAAGRRRELQQGLERAPWIRDLFPFDARTLAVLERAEARTTAESGEASLTAEDESPRAPQLHQKTQLIARAGAISALLRIPGWDDVLARQMESQSRESARFADQIGYATPSLETEGTRSTDAMLTAFEAALPEEERRRASFYFAAGTQNMDPRGLALDAEATIVTSGFQGISGLVDIYRLMARTTWITERSQLDELIAPPSPFWRMVARLARTAF
jgi:hypothetical protein